MAADVLDDDQWLYGEEASTKDVKEEPQPTITENGRRVSLGYTSVIQIY